MAENTSIEWADHTFNPWFGCTKVSPGCDHCYAEARMDTRLHRVRWGAGEPRVRTKDWSGPERWNRQHEAFYAAHGRRQRVFCASLADVFDNQVAETWRIDLFALIEQTPHLDWLLLTKRIGNAPAMPPWGPCSPPWSNVWLGASIVNRDEMLRDGPKLKATPARVRFWSVEPMLGDLGEIPPELMPDWVIVGGESGPGARPMHPDWARSLRDQCAAGGVPWLFKQWGDWSPGYAEHGNDLGYDTIVDAKQHEWPEGHCAFRVGKKAAGRLLDGRTHDEFPEVRW